MENCPPEPSKNSHYCTLFTASVLDPTANKAAAGLAAAPEFVILSRGYCLIDPALNLGLKAMLEERGYRVAYGVHNHAHIYKQYPNLYWSFGTYLLASAKAARSKAGIYAVYPSYHGCGPDGVLSHWFEDEAKGKPYLSLEIDEHASKVGLITRLEAFINFSLSALPGDAALYAEQNQNAQLLFP